MNTATRRYHSPLRQAQAEATRELILQAVGRLLEEGDESALSYGAVARAAGIQERTVYRYFPTRETLLDAFWIWVNAQAGFTRFPETEQDLADQPKTVFAGFDAVEGLIRNSLGSKHGREMRLRANTARQAAFRRSLAAATRGLDPVRVKQAHAAIQLLYSASAWQTMKDYWGMTGAEAGAAASWAIQALIEALRREQARTHEGGARLEAEPEEESPQ